jgi:hypothetical protein
VAVKRLRIAEKGEGGEREAREAEKGGVGEGTGEGEERDQLRDFQVCAPLPLCPCPSAAY